MKTYFIGIGGIGMSALALYLLEKGEKVAGSDLKESPVTLHLKEKGAEIVLKQDGTGISEGMRVVYSSAVKEENGDFQKAKTLHCSLMHRSELLWELARSHRTVAFAGTHGKTTTSGLMAHVLMESGQDPSFLIGGIPHSLGVNGRYGKGEWCVIEADESDGSFSRYYPDAACITNIDDDHLDHYGSFENLKEAFQNFQNQVKGAPFLFCGDDPLLKELCSKGESYGFSEDCTFYLSHFQPQGFTLSFNLTYQGRCFEAVELNLTGKHNALNGGAVFAMAYLMGIEEAAIRKAFRSFSGVGKRMDPIFQWKEKRGFHDYAHHPTEIEATLNGLRLACPSQKILAVFQPHRFSRTHHCLPKFSGIFKGCDQLLVTDIFAAGEVDNLGLSMEKVLSQCPRGASYIPREEVARKVKESLEQFDVVITLGAGDIGAIFKEIG